MLVCLNLINLLTIETIEERFFFPVRIMDHKYHFHLFNYCIIVFLDGSNFKNIEFIKREYIFFFKNETIMKWWQIKTNGSNGSNFV